MPKRGRFLLIGLIWIATFLRTHSLFNNHFHADEALFASWARLIAIWRDPLLLTQAVDKPPLLFYFQALFYPLFGPEEWAARLPNYLVSLLLVPLVAVLAWHLYHKITVSLLAALFIAISPLAIQFSGTAFTDPLLSAFVALSVLFVLYRPSPALSGLFFGLAAVTKYQAWLFLPLIMGMAWHKLWTWRKVGMWLLGAIPIIIAFIIWGFSRNGIFILWSRQVNNFGGIRFAWSWELLNRLDTWAHLWLLSFGTLLAIGLFVAGMVVLLVRGFYVRDYEARIDLLLILFVTAYMILHWILAVPIWDRYLVSLFPFVAILLARVIVFIYQLSFAGVGHNAIDSWMQKFTRIVTASFLLLILLLQLSPAVKARVGLWPLGGQKAADRGSWQVAEFLANEPYGTVLYDHWYSWHWRYQLFDKKVYVSWFQHPQALIDDLHVFGREDNHRYLALPNSVESIPVRRVLSANGYELSQVMQTDGESGMTLYRIKRRGENG